jgi:outer membrane protein insertion porin family
MGFAFTASAAVTDYIGKPIESVRVLTEGRETTEPAILQVVETVAGQPLSMMQIRETVTHLFSLGQFEDVRVDATLENGRVALRYDLIPIHPITRIRFAGHPSEPGIDEGALRRSLSDRFGITPAVGKAADMARVMSDLLAERGYRRARITPAVAVQHAPEQATVTFTIEPGVRTTLAPIEIVGAPSVPRADFLQRLGLAAGAPYQREQLTTRIERYIGERRGRGYYEAKVTPTVTFTDDERIAHVTLTVNHGPHVSVVFAGDPLQSDVQRDLVPVEREGSVDEDLLEDSTARIEDYLRNLGYRDAKAPHVRADVNGELVITFTVRRGPQYRVASLEITGNTAVPAGEFESNLKLREGQPFSDSRVDADASLIEDLYRRRGFASAKVQPTPDLQRRGSDAAQVPVRVRLEVFEGAQTFVDAVRFAGNSGIADQDLRAALSMQAGAPYVPGQLAVDRDALLLTYSNHGYENATVTPTPEFSADNAHVTIVFAIREGPQIFVDHVLIVGNVRTASRVIERELQLQMGDPLSLSKVNDSQRRLLGLGLFRRVRINELRHGEETKRDLLVTVEESPPSTIGYGFGGEGRLLPVAQENGVAATRFQVLPRAFFEYGRRNLFGKPRSINLFSSVSVPLNQTAGSGRLAEYRLIGTYREPRLFDSATDGLLNVTAEQQIRSSFTYRRNLGTLQVARRLSRELFVTGAYQIQRTELVAVSVSDTNNLTLIGRLFTPAPLRLSAFSASVIRDTRNDQVNPTGGQYFSINGQIDSVAIGSQVGFAKSFFRAQTFHMVPGSNGIVFAANASLGLAAEFNADAPIPEPERFFAGGDTTNRGFAVDTLGVRHDPPADTDTIDKNGFPIGGDATVILNGELRVPVRGGVSVVGFVDSGNVFQRVSLLSLNEFRNAVGFGVRYQSPFGPLRIDLGFKTHVDVFRCPTDADPSRTCPEARPAFHISFGQAF